MPKAKDPYIEFNKNNLTTSFKLVSHENRLTGPAIIYHIECDKTFKVANLGYWLTSSFGACKCPFCSDRRTFRYTKEIAEYKLNKIYNGDVKVLDWSNFKDEKTLLKCIKYSCKHGEFYNNLNHLMNRV